MTLVGIRLNILYGKYLSADLLPKSNGSVPRQLK